MYYITYCDGVSVDIRVLNWNQKNLQINDRLQSHSNTSAVCFPMRLQLLERFVGIMKNITWKYKCFPATSPLKNMQVCSERSWLFSTKACKLGIAVLLSSTIVQMYLYIYTKTGKQLDKGIGLEKNTTNWHWMSVVMALSA